MTRECHAGILWEPGGEIPPGHPTGVLREGAAVSEKYEFIDAECATLPVEGEAPTVVQMCEWLGVSKSGFYDWRTRPLSETAQRRELLEIKIKALFEANNSEYGYRRIHAALVRGGESVDDETVRKIMRDLGLEPCQPKPWRFSLTEQDGQAGPIPSKTRVATKYRKKNDCYAGMSDCL